MNWLSFTLGFAVGWIAFLLWLGWDAVVGKLRPVSWSELTRPIAWDGPWTNGPPTWSVHARVAYWEPWAKMVYRSSTGRKLVTHNNTLKEFTSSGTAVYT